MKEIDKLMILLKNKAIYESCLEDISIWEIGEKKPIYLLPNYVRFPECFDFAMNNKIRSDIAKKHFKEIIKSIDKNLRGIINSDKFRLENSKAKYVYPSNEFIQQRQKFLDIHLTKLREIRAKRKGDELIKEVKR